MSSRLLPSADGDTPAKDSRALIADGRDGRPTAASRDAMRDWLFPTSDTDHQESVSGASSEIVVCTALTPWTSRGAWVHGSIPKGTWVSLDLSLTSVVALKHLEEPLPSASATLDSPSQDDSQMTKCEPIWHSQMGAPPAALTPLPNTQRMHSDASMEVDMFEEEIPLEYDNGRMGGGSAMGEAPCEADTFAVDSGDGDGTELDESEWLSVDGAAHEHALLQEQRMPPSPRPSAQDTYRVDRNPPSPMSLMEPTSTPPHHRAFVTARDLQRRRWARMRASPSSLSDVPVDLHSKVLLHVPLGATARLALCSKAWLGAVTTACTTEEWWTSVGKRLQGYFDAKPGRWPGVNTEACELNTGAAELLGVLSTLSEGPKAAMALLSAMRDASEKVEKVRLTGFRAPPAEPYLMAPLDVIFGDGPNDFAPQLGKCPRAHEWTTEMVVDLAFFNAYDNPDAFEKEFDRESTSNLANDCSTTDDCFRHARKRGFSVSHNDVVKAALARFPQRSMRVAFIEESFGYFVDDWVFEEVHATRMGSFVAAAEASLDDVMALVEDLSEMEGDAEQHGHQNNTFIVLRTWANDADFPTAWPPADVHRFFGRVGAWDARLRQLATPLMATWLKAILAPVLMLVDDGASPNLALANSLMDALASE